MIAVSELSSILKRLRLSGILETLDLRNQQAIAEHWTHVEFLGRLALDEVERRGGKQLDLRLRRGLVDTAKTLESFDFSFNPTISRAAIYDLATCQFIQQRRNCLICGQTGVGKSHLAMALCHEAARKGYDVMFTSAHKLLFNLAAARADGSYDRRLAAILRVDLLALDDFGLRALPPTGAEDLYEIIDGRYERRSILLTSNRAPNEWLEMLGDPLLANAALDRLADRAHIVSISGRSFRLAGRKALSEAAGSSKTEPASIITSTQLEEPAAIPATA